jgi:hypothetical protein
VIAAWREMAETGARDAIMEKRRAALREAKGELTPEELLAKKEPPRPASPNKIAQLEWELQQPIDEGELKTATQARLKEIVKEGRRGIAQRWKHIREKDDASAFRHVYDSHIPH